MAQGPFHSLNLWFPLSSQHLRVVLHFSLGSSGLQSNACPSPLLRGTQCPPHSRSHLVRCHFILHSDPWHRNFLFILTIPSPLLYIWHQEAGQLVLNWIELKKRAYCVKGQLRFSAYVSESQTSLFYFAQSSAPKKIKQILKQNHTHAHTKPQT